MGFLECGAVAACSWDMCDGVVPKRRLMNTSKKAW